LPILNFHFLRFLDFKRINGVFPIYIKICGAVWFQAEPYGAGLCGAGQDFADSCPNAI